MRETYLGFLLLANTLTDYVSRNEVQPEVFKNRGEGD